MRCIKTIHIVLVFVTITLASTEQNIREKKSIENPITATFQKQDFTRKLTTEYHVYYNSSSYVDQKEVIQIWDTVKNLAHNPTLSDAHRKAITIDLTFDFPFYGQSVRNIAVTSGGFVYTGDYVHSWLAATQYIAPLMANFDTRLSDASFVRYHDNGTAFSVVWENVFVQEQENVGGFTFMLTLHKSGEIVFAYYKLPILLSTIQNYKHSVNIGLSDAYVLDISKYLRRKTIYDRIDLTKVEISNFTLIRLMPLPTCHSYTDCTTCTQHLETSLNCSWCSMLNRCSTGYDRGTQNWNNKDCNGNKISDILACPVLDVDNSIVDK